MLQPCNVPVMDVKALYTYTFELNCVVFFFSFLESVILQSQVPNTLITFL